MAPRLGDEIATFQFVVIQEGTVFPVPFKKRLLSHYYEPLSVVLRGTH